MKINIPGELRRFAGAFLINDKMQLLLQLRDDNPSIDNPGRISVFGGGIEPKETFREGLLRELVEELGITFDTKEVRFLASTTKIESRITTDCEFYFIEAQDFSRYTILEGTGTVLSLFDAHLDARLTPTCRAMVCELQLKYNYVG